MNIQLPNNKTQKGFTLIELLVVITIIAILSIVAIVIFTGLQRNARNAARQSDIKAIGNALEVNKTASGYIALAGTQFSSGVIPAADPQNNPYCIAYVAQGTALPANPAVWTTTCPSSPVSFAQVPGTLSATGGYKVCATIEGATAAANTVFCQSSQQ